MLLVTLFSTCSQTPMCDGRHIQYPSHKLTLGSDPHSSLMCFVVFLNNNMFFLGKNRHWPKVQKIGTKTTSILMDFGPLFHHFFCSQSSTRPSRPWVMPLWHAGATEPRGQHEVQGKKGGPGALRRQKL